MNPISNNSITYRLLIRVPIEGGKCPDRIFYFTSLKILFESLTLTLDSTMQFRLRYKIEIRKYDREKHIPELISESKVLWHHCTKEVLENRRKLKDILYSRYGTTIADKLFAQIINGELPELKTKYKV